MKRRIKYSDEPMKFKIVDDFLPSPEKMAAKEENVKVTMLLSKSSLEFFRKWAKKKHSHYQAMIRKILDHYVSHYRHKEA